MLFLLTNVQEFTVSLVGAVQDAHFVCDNKGRLEELHAPLALLHSLQEVSCRFSSQTKLTAPNPRLHHRQHPDCLQAALEWQKKDSADRHDQAARGKAMQLQLEQQAKSAQVGI